MSTPEVVPFGDEHLEDAAALLAARHARHRQAEPLLSERYEDPAAARAEIELAWRADGASGAAALRDGRLAGYLIGAPRAAKEWGENVWVEAAGHAVERAEDVRDLYAARRRALGRGGQHAPRRHRPGSRRRAARRVVATRLRTAAGARDPGGADEHGGRDPGRLRDPHPARGRDRGADRRRHHAARPPARLTRVRGLFVVAGRLAGGVGADARRRRGDRHDRLPRAAGRSRAGHSSQPSALPSTGASPAPRTRAPWASPRRFPSPAAAGSASRSRRPASPGRPRRATG